MDDESIFPAALSKPPGVERRAFLDGVCTGDHDLRQRIERLLEADGQAGGTLQRGPDGPIDPPRPGERPSGRVGPYKLLQRIGEGGMGVVYMAEQTKPVRRNIALKIIKLGMDRNQVVARSEAERQALALMDHPSIARVFGASATESGRPYFVMELVKGIPIVDYCDQQQFTTRERLELFLSVCQAVQHAHQNYSRLPIAAPGNLVASAGVVGHAGRGARGCGWRSSSVRGLSCGPDRYDGIREQSPLLHLCAQSGSVEV
jgi:hypothetical protein